MLRGRFGDTTGRPYLEGRLFLPRLKLQAQVSFLLDTGADHTILMPLDGTKMLLPYGRLGRPRPMTGVGGAVETFGEKATVTFRGHDNTLYNYEIQIGMLRPAPANMTLPSLLGRDIIDNWNIRYDPRKGRLTTAVRACTFVVRP